MFLIAAPHKALAIDISQAPTEAILQPQPPNFMIVLDNSGSMKGEVLASDGDDGSFQIKIVDPNSDNQVFSFSFVQYGLPSDGEYDTINIGTWNRPKYVNVLKSPGKKELAPYWRSRWGGSHKTTTNSALASGFRENSSNENGMYYSPFIKYSPWKTFASPSGVATPMTQAAIPPASTLIHPKQPDSTIKLTDAYATLTTTSLSLTLNNAHYFVWSESNGGQAYLVNFEGSTPTRKYYRVDDDKDGIIEEGELTSVTSLPADITTDPDWIGSGLSAEAADAADLQNFANWCTYYRTRWNTSVAACSKMIDLFKNINIGIYSINTGVRYAAVKHRVLNPVDLKINSYVKTMTDDLYQTTPGGYTPLRTALNTIGTYYKSGINVGRSNWPSPLKGACQQNFAMVFTDGYWNQEFSSLPEANPDNTSPTPATGIYTGAGVGSCPYKDDYEYTLADVAMYYYKTDLSTEPNNVPTNGADNNTQQHMVTYTVGLGLKGQDMDDFTTDSCNWPQPVEGTLTTINDLDHAARNGRGLFLNAKNPTELERAFSRVVSDVQSRAGSAASISVNGEQISDSLRFYQSSFYSEGWRGDVTSKKLDSNGNPSMFGWVAADGSEVTASEMLNNLDNKPDVLPGYLVAEDTVYDLRKIITYNGSSGIPFRDNNVTTAQKKQLVPSAITPEPANYTPEAAKVTDIINYIRGDHRKEKRYNGIFRNRGKIEATDDDDGEARSIIYNYKLGDIVHSTPVYNNGVLYVGANDGMLHALSAENGRELFAYIPNLVFSKLWMLSDSLYDNAHQYYVDLSPYAKKITSGKTLLVGGLGGGGKGIYCLDITNANGSIDSESSAASMVKWEYSATADDDMGFSYSKPIIVNTRAGWKVIFGNGYNSKNGKAVLYIASVDANGSLGTVTKIDTLSGGNTDLNSDGDTNDLGESNGLSTPNIIDADGNGYYDYVYAGDLFGNMWKFNIKDANVANWKTSYGTVAAPKPLFRAKNGSSTSDNGANSMPITSRPEVMYHCRGGYPGYMVVFGTGIYLGSSDITNKAIQGIFGVWDYGDDTDDTEYIGTFDISANSGAGSFITTKRSPDLPSTISMVKQGLDAYTLQDHIDGQQDVSVVARVLTATEPNWATVDDGDPNQKKNPTNDVGWYFPLKYNTAGESGNGKEVGERVVNDIIIRDGAAIVTSMVPDMSSACSVGGESWLYVISACTGGRLDQAHIDANNDNKINKSDLVQIPGKKVAIAGVHYGTLIYPPTIVRQNDSSSETKYMSTGAGTIVKSTGTPEKRGMFYWRTY